MKIMASGPINLWQIDGETMETDDKNYMMINCNQPKNKKRKPW